MNVYLGTTELDDVALQSTGLDAILLGTEKVRSSKEELLLARDPHYSGASMVWDGVDSIGFKFTDVNGYSGEIWMADTDYGMPSLNYMNLYPNIVPTEEDKYHMRNNGGENLYIPGNLTVQNVYQNGSWQGTVDLSTYDGTPSSDWDNAHFVGTTEWQIICSMFSNYNQWELPDGTPLYTFVGVQIPGTIVSLSAYEYVTYEPGTGKTLLSKDGVLGYIPGDYSIFASSSSYRSAVINGYNPALPYNYPLMFDVIQQNKAVNLGKMRVLNTTKTNYSENTSTS